MIKKIIILFISLMIILGMMTSCYVSNNNIIKNNQFNQTDNTNNIDNNTQKGISSEGKIKETMFKNIVFDQISGSDREGGYSVASNFILRNNYEGSYEGYENEFAFCIATVTSIDKSKCNPDPEIGTNLPVTLRIDTIIGSTPTFSLKCGESATVYNTTVWSRNDEGYTVYYRDGAIPVTEEGAQYLIIIYKISEDYIKEIKEIQFYKDYWDDLKYKVEALTIPINNNFDLTDEEIYETLKLPDDVKVQSIMLIDYFIHNKTQEEVTDFAINYFDSLRPKTIDDPNDLSALQREETVYDLINNYNWSFSEPWSSALPPIEDNIELYNALASIEDREAVVDLMIGYIFDSDNNGQIEGALVVMASKLAGYDYLPGAYGDEAIYEPHYPDSTPKYFADCLYQRLVEDHLHDYLNK